MTEFFIEYGLFLLKTLTILVAIVVIIGAVTLVSKKAVHHDGLEIEDLNKRYRMMANAVKQAVMKKEAWKKEAKAEKIRAKGEDRSDTKPIAFVIDFKGDLKASAAASLREEVSTVLEVARPDDKVVVRLENYGGVVHEHGLAASQLSRVREREISLTVAVDKVAASGGYLMACVANKIVAAPFAILGSIGVLAQIPNFNRLLENHGVDFEMIMAGKHKRNVTMFGRNTDEDREKLKAELEEVHTLFKAAITKYRPHLNMDQVATGEHWYGAQALGLGLTDELKTSDELLLELAADHNVYRVSYKMKLSLQRRILANADGLMNRIDTMNWRRRFESRLPR